MLIYLPAYIIVLLWVVLRCASYQNNRIIIIGFFLNGAECSLNSVHLINHWSMNSVQLKDPISHICLVGAVVASWSRTQEMAGSSPFNDKYFLSANSLNSVTIFRKNSIVN